jgi:hypothetical protein
MRKIEPLTPESELQRHVKDIMVENHRLREELAAASETEAGQANPEEREELERVRAELEEVRAQNDAHQFVQQELINLARVILTAAALGIRRDPELTEDDA